MTQPKTKSSPNLGPWKTIIMGPLPNDQLVENVTILVFEQFISIWEMNHVQNSNKIEILFVKMPIIVHNILSKLRSTEMQHFKINKSPSSFQFFEISLKFLYNFVVFSVFTSFHYPHFALNLLIPWCELVLLTSLFTKQWLNMFLKNGKFCERSLTTLP